MGSDGSSPTSRKLACEFEVRRFIDSASSSVRADHQQRTIAVGVAYPN